MVVRAAARRARTARRFAVALLSDTRHVLVRNPATAVALSRAIIGERDAALLSAVDKALAGRRTTGLLTLRAQLLEMRGEVTEARATWREVGQRGSGRARARIEMLDGRITETETTWLPRLPGGPEPLEPLSRRRVLHITKSSAPERWSGFTIRTMHNLHAQQAAGIEPMLVTEIGWPRVTGVTDIEPVIQVEGVTHYRLDRGPDYDPLNTPNDRRDADTTEALLPLVRELRPAILHAHSGYRGGEHALMALALREKLGIPVVYEVRGLFETVWSRDPAIAAGSELFARRLAQETRILHDVDGVLAISEALADDMVARGIPREKITILPNGIDPEALVRPDRDTGLRGELGLEGRFVVGYLGNLDHRREGIDVLIAAIARLHAQGRSDIALLVVGDGTERPALEAEVTRLGVAGACRFIGRVPHASVAQYYAQMDLFANTRIEERAARYITPLKPYEAMALGIPVLVSDLPALREIVDPPNRGLTAPVGDAAGLADAIARLVDDPAERARIAEAGRTWVRSERTWRANGDRYRAAYERILGPLDAGRSG